MRKSSLLVASVICASLAIGSTPAIADTPTSPKIKSSKVRNPARDAINLEFKKAVDRANADYRIALSLATTMEEKVAARTAQKAAIIAATTIRDASLIALTPSVIPTEAPRGDNPRLESGEKAPRGAKPKRN